MCTVVNAPSSVLTLHDACLGSSAQDVVHPDLSSAATVAVTNEISSVSTHIRLLLCRSVAKYNIIQAYIHLITHKHLPKSIPALTAAVLSCDMALFIIGIKPINPVYDQNGRGVKRPQTNKAARQNGRMNRSFHLTKIFSCRGLQWPCGFLGTRPFRRAAVMTKP